MEKLLKAAKCALADLEGSYGWGEGVGEHWASERMISPFMSNFEKIHFRFTDSNYGHAAF